MSIPVTPSIFTNVPGVVRLVQGDTKPPMVVNLTTESTVTATGGTTSTPLDVRDSVVIMKLKRVGETLVYDTVTGTLLEGYEQEDGTVDTTAPYNIPGAGGRVIFGWNEASLEQAGEVDGEISVTFIDDTIQTAYNTVRLSIRPQF